MGRYGVTVGGGGFPWARTSASPLQRGGYVDTVLFRLMKKAIHSGSCFAYANIIEPGRGISGGAAFEGGVNNGITPCIRARKKNIIAPMDEI